MNTTKHSKAQIEAAIELICQRLSANDLKSDFELGAQLHIQFYRQARDELDDLRARGLLSELSYDTFVVTGWAGALALGKEKRGRGKKATYRKRDFKLQVLASELCALGFSDLKAAEILHTAIVRKFKYNTLSTDSIYKIIQRRPRKFGK